MKILSLKARQNKGLPPSTNRGDPKYQRLVDELVTLREEHEDLRRSFFQLLQYLQKCNIHKQDT
jgi:hypothetical protein